MDEYIKREDLLELYRMDDPVLNKNGHVPLPVIRQNIMDIPAADVAPVRHGRWLNKKEWHLGRWVAWLECSCCGEHDYNAEMYEMLPFGAGPSNYCPNCGAKMDGGDNDASD